MSWDAFARLVALVLALALVTGVQVPALAKTADGDTVLAFTSDVHNKSADESLTRLDKWVNTMTGTYGNFEYMGFCGDMGDANVGESQFWEFATRVFNLMETKTDIIDTIRYTTGNHEYNPGNIGSTQEAANRARYTIDAEGANGSNYRVYCLGCASGTQQYTQEQVNKLTTYLSNCDTSKPIFIMTHYPLHYLASGRRSTGNANLVINALNAAADEGKTIVFLWGHNHSQGDGQYDKFVQPGESLTYANGSSTNIKFIYAAAGCMSDSEYVGSGSVNGKGLIITVDKDTDEMIFTYHNDKGGTVAQLDYAPTPTTKYTITWLDDDGSQLASTQVRPGEVPSYPYTTPTKAATAQYTYTFAGWTPDVVAADADATYTATYTRTPISQGGEWKRLAGDGRYDTMAAIVSEGFTRSKYAVIATGKDYPDALVAASLAGALDCPVILTKPDGLSKQAFERLHDLHVEEAYVVGGESAVSKNVMDSLEGLDIVATRVSDTSRQGTSIAALEKIVEEKKFTGTAVIATGYSFADALSIGPWCFKTATPILLTNKSGKLTDAEVTAAKKAGVTSLIIVGGEKAVSDEVYTQLGIDKDDSGSTRLAGDNRYETSQKIAVWELAERGMTMANTAVATGVNFPDALAGAALCGHNNSVLLLAKNKDSVSLKILGSDSGVETGYVLGGESAVSAELFAYLESLTS